VTARPFAITALPPTAFAPGWFSQSSLWSLRPPKIEDQISLGVPIPLLGGSINFGYVHEEDPFGNRVELLDVGYSRQVFGCASFFATPMPVSTAPGTPVFPSVCRFRSVTA
jgi:hypothetical protein